jgi:hypothetical protein
LGPGIVIKLSDLDAPLINGFNPLSSTATERHKPGIRLNSQSVPTKAAANFHNLVEAIDFS